LEGRKRDQVVTLIFLHVETKAPAWFQSAKELYFKKISGFVKVEEWTIKSPPQQRKDSSQKVSQEAQKILAKLIPSDFLVLFDEKGKSYDSIAFSSELQKVFERSPQRIVFLIGGAFGVDSSIQERAQWKVSLGKMTMNHLVAQIVSLEQVYRALTIQKNIPYHNE